MGGDSLQNCSLDRPWSISCIPDAASKTNSRVGRILQLHRELGKILQPCHSSLRGAKSAGTSGRYQWTWADAESKKYIWKQIKTITLRQTCQWRLVTKIWFHLHC